MGDKFELLKTPVNRTVVRKKNKNEKLRLRVIFLDDSERVFEVERKILGSDFFNKVCGHLKLLEKEYFGLEFRHHTGSYVWLELLKPVAKQIKNISDVAFHFIVKLFPPDPGQLQRRLTRYLFALQIKQDLSNGSLTCNDNSAALLVSHILQAEIGDYDEELDAHHLEIKQYVPNQEYLDHKIIRFHKKHSLQGETLLSFPWPAEMCVRHSGRCVWSIMPSSDLPKSPSHMRSPFCLAKDPVSDT
uniref:FERM domain-containing protein n=1 Tax=Cyprinus carpio carpio TaxID=630221 RepID=A0A9J8DDL1_CYPCA